MLRTLRKRRCGTLFSLAAGLVIYLAAAARAADLALPPEDQKILDMLKAKRLMRCPQTDTRPRCGGAELQSPPLKGPLRKR